LAFFRGSAILLKRGFAIVPSQIEPQADFGQEVACKDDWVDQCIELPPALGHRTHLRPNNCNKLRSCSCRPTSRKLGLMFDRQKHPPSKKTRLGIVPK
jgi:hypothetical protein